MYKNAVNFTSVITRKKAVKNINKRKAPRVNRITSEMLKYDGEYMIVWLVMVCNVCFI